MEFSNLFISIRDYIDFDKIDTNKFKRYSDVPFEYFWRKDSKSILLSLNFGVNRMKDANGKWDDTQLHNERLFELGSSRGERYTEDGSVH